MQAVAELLGAILLGIAVAALTALGFSVEAGKADEPRSVRRIPAAAIGAAAAESSLRHAAVSVCPDLPVTVVLS